LLQQIYCLPLVFLPFDGLAFALYPAEEGYSI